MLGLSIGLGGLAVAPMAAVAERAGLPVVLYAAGVLSVAGAAIMSRVPKPPAAPRGGRAAPSLAAAERDLRVTSATL